MPRRAVLKAPALFGGPGFRVCVKTQFSFVLNTICSGGQTGPIQTVATICSFETDCSARPNGRLEEEGLSAPEVTLVGAGAGCFALLPTRSYFPRSALPSAMI